MKKKKSCGHRSGCPINIVLEALGDSWSLLIVRDLMFKERKRFNEFLNAEEGIATNILSDRLQRLEANGIVMKRRDPADARRHIYHLTEKGIDLAPVLVEIILWAARHATTEAPAATIVDIVKNREKFIAGIRERWSASRGF